MSQTDTHHPIFTTVLSQIQVRLSGWATLHLSSRALLNYIIKPVVCLFINVIIFWTYALFTELEKGSLMQGD